MARLRPGVEVFEGDEITTTALAHSTIEFADKTVLAINPTTSVRFDRFAFKQKQPDEFRVTLFHGVTALVGGRLAKTPDAMLVDAGPMTLGVHAANMLCRLSPNGIRAEVTLLGGGDETCGEIIVHNSVAVETLNQPNHMLRIDGKYGYVSTPMTTTSHVLEGTYRGTAVAEVLAELFAEKMTMPGEPPLSVFNGDISGFELFENLSDRLLERRFMVQHIFPDDTQPGSDDHNELLEDAFEGERFRLKDGYDPN